MWYRKAYMARKKGKSNYLEMESVINQYWISCQDFKILIPQLSQIQANKEFNSLKLEMESNKELYFNTRPVLIPIKKIIDKYHIDVNLIRREASKIRKEQL